MKRSSIRAAAVLLGRTLAAISILASLSPSATAAIPGPSEPWPVTLRAEMVRLGAVGFRLRRTAADLCPTQASQTGLLIDYIGAYSAQDRPAVAQLLGLSDQPQIAGVAPGSPAAEAGIVEGDGILAIDGEDYRTLVARSKDPSLLADQIEERFAATPSGEPIRLRIDRGGQAMDIVLRPERGCSARFVVKTGEGLEAYSDDHNVAVAAKMIAFTHSEDELALVAGHELAHVIRRDPQTSGAQRLKEDRADVLGTQLARCSGYDVVRALAFWERYGKRDWMWFLKDPTHRSPASRLALIRAQGLEGPCPPAVSR